MKDKSLISGLAQRRAILSGDIGRMQTQLKQMLSDRDVLDAAIRLLDADYPIEKIKPKGLHSPRKWTTRGELVRLILNILRKAPEPLSAREIACEVMALKQMDNSDPRAVTSMRECVGYALRKKRRSGQVRSQYGPGPFVLWEIAAPIMLPPAANTLSTAC